MGLDNFDGEDFKSFIKDNAEQINARTIGGIQETDNFKIIRSLLNTYASNNAITDFTLVLLSEDDIKNLSDGINEKVESTLLSEEAIKNNYLLINKDFDLVNSSRESFPDDNEKAREFFAGLSSEKKLCVFLVSPEGVNYFVEGKSSGEAIFYNSKAYRSYKELKDIDQLDELLNEYRTQLTHREVYRQFFVSKSSIRAMRDIEEKSGKKVKDVDDYLDDYAHLLENSPEDIFRENLRKFLDSNMKNNVMIKEMLLESFKRLDIFIVDDYGEWYLIEVKWVGISISKKGDEPRTEINAKDINPHAIIQTIGYIKELIQNKKPIKIGYLAVFDARKDNLADTGEGFDTSNVEDEDMSYYRRYKKIDDLRVVNSNPW